MAIYRTIHLSFWTDAKVDEDFTPEDKYFFLYLLTNPHTNLLGCYEIGRKQMSIETGYEIAVIDKLIARFENVHKIIKYSKATKELFVINWSKYNWTRSPRFAKALQKEIESVKTKAFKRILEKKINGNDTVYSETDTVYENEQYPSDTSVTVTVTDAVNNKDKDKDINIIKNIIGYLNEVCGSSYRVTTEKTKKLIRARLNEGFTFDNFKTVIDKKHGEWAGTDMEQYLRPETLFGTKFEGYLNQRVRGAQRSATSVIDEW